MPSKIDKVDIANDVQKGIADANERDDEKNARTQENADKERATRYDGDPQPSSDTEPSLLHPRDDTPWKLEKKSGPKNP